MNRGGEKKHKSGWISLPKPFLWWMIPGLVAITLLIGSAALTIVLAVVKRPSELRIIIRSGEIAIVGNTLVICLGVTIIAAIVGWIFGVVLRFAGSGLMWLIVAVVLFPLLSDQIIRNYAFYFIFRTEGIWSYGLSLIGIENPPHVLYTRLGVIIGISHGLISLSTFPVWLSLQRVSNTSLNAATVHGAKWFQLVRDLVFPASLPGIIAGAFFTFVFTLGYYVTPKMLGGQSGMMISALIDQRINTLGDWYGSSALSLLVLVICLPFLMLTPRLLLFLEKRT